MILASLLSSSKYIIVNKDLIQVLGLHEAVILGELCSEYTYWENTNQLEDNEYFYSTRENIEKNTGINAHFQRMAMKNLEEKGIVVSKRKGIPCKKYYKIDESKLIEYLQKAKIMDNLPVVHEVNDKGNMTCTTSNKLGEVQANDNMDVNNNNINNKIINNEEHTHPVATSNVRKKEYAMKVEMNEKEYNDLVVSYGEETTKQLIEQLSLYKQAHGKSYDSDYAAIMRWVTVRLHEMEKEKASYNKFKNKDIKIPQNALYSREYPP